MRRNRFEWQKEGGKKQPFYIYHRKKQPLFFVAIGKQPYGQDHGKEGFVIVTSSSNQGSVWISKIIVR